MTNNKKIHIECLRILAIFFVIFNHTGTTGFQYYTTLNFSVKYILCSSLSVLCTVAVPLFFMISGALLLKKDESFKKILKRITRIFFVLVLTSLFYYIISADNFNQLSIIDFIRIIYTDTMTTPLWYLYAYLAFLFTLPFLRLIARNMKDNDFKYLIILSLLFSVGRSVIAGLTGYWLNKNFSILFIESTIYYPLIGYYVEHRLDIKKFKKIHMILIFILLIINIFVGSLFNYLQILRSTNSLDQTFLSSFNSINAIIVYIFIKFILNKVEISIFLKKIVNLVGGCTFGIYLIEEFLRSKLYWRFYNFINIIFGNMITSILSVICCIFIGTLFMFLLKKLPVIKNLL